MQDSFPLAVYADEDNAKNHPLVADLQWGRNSTGTLNTFHQRGYIWVHYTIEEFDLYE